MELSKRQQNWLKELVDISGVTICYLNDFYQGKMTWDELWKSNLSQVNIENLPCSCRFIELSNRPRGTTREKMEKSGCHFTLLSSEQNQYSKRASQLKCHCGQLWKEQEVEAMQYWSFHMYPENN